MAAIAAPRREVIGDVARIALRLSDDSDASDVAMRLAEASKAMGADVAAFASFVCDDESYESYRFVVACDAAWCLEYEATACYMHDPWLAYVRRYAEPVLATGISVRADDERAVVRLAERFGFRSALIVPAQAPQGLTRLGALCLGSETVGFFEQSDLPAMSFAATGLAARVHQWQIGQLRRELLSRADLSEGELELLRFERAGLKSKQVAQVTGSTWQSVDSRWQRLNAKFDVASRSVAARIAAEYGLI